MSDTNNTEILVGISRETLKELYEKVCTLKNPKNDEILTIIEEFGVNCFRDGVMSVINGMNILGKKCIEMVDTEFKVERE